MASIDALQRLLGQWETLSLAQRELLNELTELIDVVVDEAQRGSGHIESLSTSIAEITANQELYRSGYSEVTPEGVALLVTDQDTIIRRANERAAHLLRKRPDLLVGQSLSELVHGASRAWVEDLLGLIRSQEAIVEEHELSFTVTADQPLETIVTAIAIHDPISDEPMGIKWLLRRPGVHHGVQEDDTFDTHERLRATFEQTAVGMAHLTLGGHFERVNQHLCELTGYAENDLLALGLQDLLKPEDFAVDEGYAAQLIEGRLETYSVDVRMQRADGAFFWARQTVSLMNDRFGEPYLRIVVVEDINDQKTGEKELLNALNRAQDLYQIGRSVGRARSANDILEAVFASRYFGAPNRASVLLFDRAWLPDDVPECCDVIAEWVIGDENAPSLLDQTYLFEEYAFEQLFLRDETVFIQNVGLDARLSEAARSLFQQTGAATIVLSPLEANAEWYGILTVHYPERHSFSLEEQRHMAGIIDQAAVAIANIQLLKSEEEARREAEQANEVKMRFLAVVSHELRTPLSSIKGFVSTLLADDVEWSADEQQDFLLTINDEADKLSELIEQILNLSRLESGTLEITRETITIDAIVSLARAQLSVLTDEHDLIITLPDDPPAVLADPRRVAQVIVNLVSNAVRYSPSQTPIELEVSAQKDYVQVEVRDQGPGIPLEHQQEIFQPFSRATVLATEQGMGLGLAISRGIIDRHDGRIWVQKSDEAGTTMAFSLPVQS